MLDEGLRSRETSGPVKSLLILPITLSSLTRDSIVLINLEKALFCASDGFLQSSSCTCMCLRMRGYGFKG